MPDVDFLGRPINTGGMGQGGGTDFLGRPIGGQGLGTGSPVEQSGGGIVGSTLSVLAPVLDFLSRGQYASAGFFDSLINDRSSLTDALSVAGRELIDPTQRKSFRDVLQRYNPDFVNNNPKTASVLGFLGDIALDPTTYIGFGLGGATKGARIGGRALTTLGETYQAAARGALAGKEIALGLQGATYGAAETLGKEALSRLPREIAQTAKFSRAEAAASFFDESTADVVKRAASGIGQDLRATIGGKLPNGVTDEALDTLAERISLERLGLPDTKQAVNYVTRQLGEQEIVDTADNLILKLATISPGLEKQLFKSGGLRLSVGIPLTGLQKEIPIINREVLQAVGLDKLDGIVKTVAALPGIKQTINAGRVLRGAFDRFYQLPEDYVQTITKLENEFDFIKADVVRDAQAIVTGISAEGRERISKVMNAFHAGIEELSAEQRLYRAPEIFQMALRQSKLEPKEQATVMSLIQGYSRAAELEKAALVSGQSAANFDPRVYQAIGANADEAADWMRRANDDGIVDAAGLDVPKSKKAADLAAAIAEGANIKQDAVLLYAQRAIQARHRVSKLQANAAIQSIFGTTDLTKLPPRVASDLRYFGDYYFPTFADDDANAILSTIDRVQRAWKLSKTAINPGFAPKQAIQNTLQASLVMGNNAFRAFDPRAYTAASFLLWGRQAPSRSGLPEYASQWIQKFMAPEEAQLAAQLAGKNLADADKALDLGFGLQIRTAAGTPLSREALQMELKQQGIVRGTSGFSGEMLKRSLQEEIGQGPASSITAKGFEAIKGLANGYLGLSSKVEDTSRTALYINARMMGDSPAQAAQRVNRALFDYSRSFSRFETEVVKRLIPFYSFNRLALPLALRSTLENPGGPAALNKVADLMGKLISGDENGNPATLTPAERQIFGGSYLIDQPRIFKGFSADGNPLFNVFNNLTPFDVLSIFTVSKKNGETDWQRTAEKNIGGLLTPFIKIPAEILANRDFFSDRVIADVKGDPRKLGKVSQGGFYQRLDAALPQPIKEMLSWELGTDRRTGEQIAYINPYFAYSMAQLAPPVAQQFVKPLGDDESIIERAMRMTFGIGETTLDLKKSKQGQNFEDSLRLKELRDKIRIAQRQGRQNSLAQAQEDYRKVLRAISSRDEQAGGPSTGE